MTIVELGLVCFKLISFVISFIALYFLIYFNKEAKEILDKNRGDFAEKDLFMNGWEKWPFINIFLCCLVLSIYLSVLSFVIINQINKRKEVPDYLFESLEEKYNKTIQNKEV